MSILTLVSGGRFPILFAIFLAGCLVLAAPGAFAAEGRADSTITAPQVLDEIVVDGTPLPDLQAAVVEAEDRLIARYNALNEDDELDIRCIKYTPTGTRFSYRYCLTKLQSRAQQKDGAELLNFMQSFDLQNGQQAPLPQTGTRLLEGWKRYRATVVRLLEADAELRELVAKRAAAQRRYEAARRKR